MPQAKVLKSVCFVKLVACSPAWAKRLAKSVKRASTLQQQDLMSANVVTKRKDNMRKFQN